jgi:hypothetical protein
MIPIEILYVYLCHKTINKKTKNGKFKRHLRQQRI